MANQHNLSCKMHQFFITPQVTLFLNSHACVPLRSQWNPGIPLRNPQHPWSTSQPDLPHPGWFANRWQSDLETPCTALGQTMVWIRSWPQMLSVPTSVKLAHDMQWEIVIRYTADSGSHEGRVGCPSHAITRKSHEKCYLLCAKQQLFNFDFFVELINPWDMLLWFEMCNFQTWFSDWYLAHFL